MSVISFSSGNLTTNFAFKDFKDNSSKSINLDPEATYNFSNWSRLEMRYNIASFRIKNIEKDDLHNYITLDNNSRNDLKILKKSRNSFLNPNESRY